MNRRRVVINGNVFEIVQNGPARDGFAGCPRMWEIGVIGTDGIPTMSDPRAPDGCFHTLREARAALGRKYGVKL